LTRRLAAPRLPLLVGGAGQIGRKMLAALAEAGCSRARVVDACAPAEGAIAAGIELEYTWHRLGQDSPELLAPALEGVDCVFSMVTPDVERATRAQHMRANADGIAELVAACRQAGVPRLVHVSSVAVTDHFTPSVEATEEVPLPAIGDYRSAYDLSKRMGEDTVLAASGPEFASVSLRAGGVISGPWDYTFRAMWDRPGNVVTLEGTEPFDFIAAEDLCRAALAAAERLDSPSVAGQAFFVTKGETTRAERLAELVGENLGWQVTKLPGFAQSCIGAGRRASHRLKELFGQPVPGIAPHDFMLLPRVQKTFDNAKARHVLGFEPQVTVEEAVARVVSEWRDANPGK